MYALRYRCIHNGDKGAAQLASALKVCAAIVVYMGTTASSWCAVQHGIHKRLTPSTACTLRSGRMPTLAPRPHLPAPHTRAHRTRTPHVHTERAARAEPVREPLRHR